MNQATKPSHPPHWLCAVLLGSLLSPSLTPLAAAPIEPKERKLAVEVLDGEAILHNVRLQQDQQIKVRVTDASNGLPVQGAVIVFQLPLDGPSANFISGTKFDTQITSEEGLATTATFRPNINVGEWEIIATASYRDYESMTLSIPQNNEDPQAVTTVTTVTTKSGSGRVLAIVLGIAGAAAGAAFGLSGGGSSSGSPTPVPAPAPTPTTLTPGAPTFGAPR